MNEDKIKNQDEIMHLYLMAICQCRGNEKDREQVDNAFGIIVKDLQRLDKIDSIDLDKILKDINTIATSEDTDKEYHIKLGRGEVLRKLKPLIDTIKEVQKCLISIKES